MTRLARWHDGLTAATHLGGQITVAAIVVFYLYEVVARYFFNAPTWWAGEMVSYALCITVFFMMPELTRTHGHVAITILVERLSQRLQVPVYFGIYIVCLAVCAVAAGISLLENLRQFTQEVHLMKNQPIPKWWISSFITYGFASSTLYFARDLQPRRMREAIAARSRRIS